MEDVWRNDSAFMQNLGCKPLTLAYPYNAKTDSVGEAVYTGRIGSRTFQTGHGQQNNKTTLSKMTAWLHDLLERGEWGVTMTRAKIGYVTPWYVDRPGFKQVCKVIKQVCKKHDIPVLDNYSGGCVIKVRDAAFRKEYFQSPTDHANLNNAGHDIFLQVGME